MNRPAISTRTRGFGLLLVVFTFTLAVGLGDGHSPNVASGAVVGDLQDQLVVGLKVRRPVDLAFIARVVTLVEDDELPMALVLSTYQWARPKTPRPYPYFERGLRIRAARIGVAI